MIEVNWQPACTQELLLERASLYARMRSFFAARQVLEVQTPVLGRHAVTDVQIDCMQTATGLFARTSPEFAMKRLLAAGCGDCYELGPVFRAAESGRWHNLEFIMLEWYRRGWRRQQLQDECLALLQHVHPPFTDWSIRLAGHAELCAEHLGQELHTTATARLRQLAAEHGLQQADAYLRSQLLDFLFSHGVQSKLPARQISVVFHFPPEQAALAQLTTAASGASVADRFELFLGPIEIANGYQELTDAEELNDRFAADNVIRAQLGKMHVEPDQRLLAAMRHGLPECAGVALGVDRLLTVISNGKNLSVSMTFPAARA